MTGLIYELMMVIVLQQNRDGFDVDRYSDWKDTICLNQYSRIDCNRKSVVHKSPADEALIADT